MSRSAFDPSNRSPGMKTMSGRSPAASATMRRLKARSVDVAQVQVAQQQGTAPTPALREPRKRDRDASHANPARIQQCRRFPPAEPWRKARRRCKAGPQPDSRLAPKRSACVPRQPAQTGRQKEVVQKSQPDGSNLVDKGQPVGSQTEAEQRRNNEAECQHRAARPAAREWWSGSAGSPEVDPGVNTGTNERGAE